MAKTRIGYSRDNGLWVLKGATELLTKKVSAFKLVASRKGEVVVTSSVEPTPEASKANYLDYNAMMDVPDTVDIITEGVATMVEWKNGVCPVCNTPPVEN